MRYRLLQSYASWNGHVNDCTFLLDRLFINEGQLYNSDLSEASTPNFTIKLDLRAADAILALCSYCESGSSLLAFRTIVSILKIFTACKANSNVMTRMMVAKMTAALICSSSQLDTSNADNTENADTTDNNDNNGCESNHHQQKLADLLGLMVVDWTKKFDDCLLDNPLHVRQCILGLLDGIQQNISKLNKTIQGKLINNLRSIFEDTTFDLRILLADSPTDLGLEDVVKEHFEPALAIWKIIFENLDGAIGVDMEKLQSSILVDFQAIAAFLVNAASSETFLCTMLQRLVSFFPKIGHLKTQPTPLGALLQSFKSFRKSDNFCNIFDSLCEALVEISKSEKGFAMQYLEAIRLVASSMFTRHEIVDYPNPLKTIQEAGRHLGNLLKVILETDRLFAESFAANFTAEFQVNYALPFTVQKPEASQFLAELLGQVAIATYDESIGRICLSSLSARFGQIPAEDTKERQFYLNQFIKLASCCSGAMFNSVIDILLALLKTGIHPNLTLSSFEKIAQGIGNDKVKRDVILVTLLRHFVDVGMAKLSSKKSERDVVKLDLTQLLDVIRILLETYPKGDLCNQITYIEMFQEFWMTLILMGYVPDLTWRTDWIDSINVISRNSPILIKPRERLQSPETTFSEVVLGKPVSPSLRAHLGTFLSTQSSSALRNLNLAQCLWLLAIYFSERGKLSDGYILHFVQYLKSEVIELLGLEDLVAEILSNLLEKMDVLETETIIQLARLLVGNLGNIQTRTHELSLRLLEKHFFELYFVYTDREVWQHLILKLSNMFIICRSEIGSHRLDHLPDDLTRDPTSGKSAFTDIVELCRKIFTRCSQDCPNYFYKFAQQKLYGPSSIFNEGDRDVALLELLCLIIPPGAFEDKKASNVYLQSEFLLYRNAENFVHQEPLVYPIGNTAIIDKIITLMCDLGDATKVRQGIRLWMGFVGGNSAMHMRLLINLTQTLAKKITNYQIVTTHPLRARMDSSPSSLQKTDEMTNFNVSCALILDFISEELQFDCVRHPERLLFYHFLARSLLVKEIKFIPRFVQLRILLFASEVLRVTPVDLVDLDSIVEFLFANIIRILMHDSYMMETSGVCSSEELGIMKGLVNFFKLEMSKHYGKRRGYIAGAALLIIGNHLTNSSVWQGLDKRDEYSDFSHSKRELVNEISNIAVGLAVRLIQIPRLSYLTLSGSGIQRTSLQAIESTELASTILERGFQVKLDTFIYCTSVFLTTAISVLRTGSQNQSSFHGITKLNLAMRSLEDVHPTHLFFYIPQIVQSLRYDTFGFAERSILHVAKASPRFSHQIIWNMRANSYLDEAATQPDPIKPLLDAIVKKIEEQFSPDGFAFYQREFSFFAQVTNISGALKPLVKKERWEKKAKIDEELSKIKVDPGVYLPSSPESIIVDIDYDSGRPLQSHAKAPFMATFRVKCNDEAPTWQSAIFKVGDDCRQDVLALQLINLAKTLFEIHGLPIYLFPYRVVATAPGCGVIEVIPRSISRDQLGREKINSLYDYFVFRFGGETSTAFHEARLNFVRSMAAYSVICYLLAIKDRHNGNIMIDDNGNIVHIDFGFILDIAPGGITFESAPFKLTSEMLQVMGGKEESPYFCWFRELCVQAFLILRAYAEAFIQLVEGMADSGLPCFRGEKTIRNLRNRFRLDLDPEGARQLMFSLVYKSCENVRTAMYDRFQLSQNGIPY